MYSQLLSFLFLSFLQLQLTAIECRTSSSDLSIHAVVITSEIIKPRSACDDSFSDSSVTVNTTARLNDLRREMIRENISAYIILSSDEHQSETVGDHDRRMKFISGFSGSNGIAVVTLEAAALWTDSRYYLQAEDEMDCNWGLMKMGISSTPTIEKWLSTQLTAGDSVSSDPKICAYQKWMAWKKNLDESGINLKVVEGNLIDRIWTKENGRPANLNEPIFVLDVQFAGVSWQDKLNILREEMKKAKVGAFVFTALDEIAWSLNLRGGDIPYFPVFRAYMVLEMQVASLYVEDGKVSAEILDHLNTNYTRPGQFVKIKDYKEIWTDLPKIAEGVEKFGLPEKYSYFTGVSFLLYNSIPEEKIKLVVSPALVKKDYKNPVEVAGMRASHIRDSLVVCQFLSMLEEDVTAGSTNWTEMRAVHVIDDLRRKQKYNAGISFGTIAAFGKNAANAHYQPSPQTDTLIDRSQLFMLDSGGHYYDGTTDCTRTVHFGTPREIEVETYTRLLMGCINLASTTFKQGYTLKELEIIIRSPLYEVGFDYGHGSTHGVGHFLAVHEAFNSTYHLNFFGSQEPGYYKENDFGMRLENIVTVVKAPASANSKQTFLTFEPVTLIPYERKLIKLDMLDRKQIAWLNNYHMRVRSLVGTEMLNQGLEKEYQWLVKKTEPITDLPPEMSYSL